MTCRTTRASIRAAAASATLLWTMTCPAGSILYVDDDAPPGGDGSSWDSAFRFLQDGLAAAGAGDVCEVRIAEGTYAPDRDERAPAGTGDRAATFQLLSGTALLGGYAGLGAADPDVRDPVGFPTVLSGDLAGDDRSGFRNIDDNALHVVTATGVDATAVIDGCTITAGNANGPNPENHGAGLLAEFGSPTVVDCRFHGHSSTQSGSALATRGSGGAPEMPLLIGCTFEGNVSTAVVNGNEGHPVFADCLFQGNGGTLGGAVRGDASSVLSASITFEQCQFLDNVAACGGAMSIDGDTTCVIRGCTFIGNEAGEIGGVDMASTVLSRIEGCLFQDNGNRALGVGGGSTIPDHPKVIDCTFVDNPDGAVLVYAGYPLFLRCTFASNSAGTGGGIDAHGGPLTLVDCLFQENSAFGGGAAIHYQDHEPLVVVGCRFVSNAGEGPMAPGAMYVTNADELWVVNSGFFGNTASRGAGLATFAVDDGRIVNCLFTGNAASFRGGALNLESTEAQLVNCTVAHNTAGNSVGGVYGSTFSDTPALSVAGSILWGNSDPSGKSLAAQIAVFVERDDPVPAPVSYSCVQGLEEGLSGPGNIGAEPRFRDAAGPDAMPGTLDDDLALAAGSPCIDAADGDAVAPDLIDIDGDFDFFEPIPTDADGLPRMIDDPGTADTGVPGPGGVVPDMGAYEFCRGDTDRSGDVGVDDLVNVILAWGSDDGGGDATGDGVIDVLDLIEVIVHWGPCV